jgi:hypothetical protein
MDTFGFFKADPSCSVPLPHLVNNADGDRIVGVCADKRAQTTSFLLACVAIGIVVVGVVWRKPVLVTVTSSAPETIAATTKAEADAATQGAVSDGASANRSLAELVHPPRPKGCSACALRALQRKQAEANARNAVQSRGSSEQGTTNQRDFADTQPVISLWWAVALAIAAVLVLKLSRPLALSRFAALRETFKSSELSKTDFVNAVAADRRTIVSAGAAVVGATLVSGAGLLGRRWFG